MPKNKGGRLKSCLPPISRFSQQCGLGRLRGSLYLFGLLLRAADTDLDLLWFGFGFLGQLDVQDAVSVLRLHVLRINAVRQAERAGEAAIATLDAMEVLFF